jgi:hypothetical protein
MRVPQIGFGFLLLVLGACGTSVPQPQSVIVSQDLITVLMTNGTTCLGPAPSAEVLSWAGRLQDCPSPYDYTVEIDPRANPLRLILVEFFEAVGLDDILSPIARVEITSPGGVTRTFVSPPPPLEVGD